MNINPSQEEKDMTQQDVLAGLAQIVNQIAGVAPTDVTMDKTFTDDLDVDSISMVEIATIAEDEFHVRIPDEDLKDLRTVGDAVNYIVSKAGVPA
jgi:acyl carrier protein